jgi:hypothetical protein
VERTQHNDSLRETNYKMTSITKNYKTATILAIITALAGVLVEASTQGNEHTALAYKGFFRGLAHIKGDHGKQGIQRPTNIDEKAICETAGENSPIHASCNNTATTGTTNADGIGTVRGSEGDDGKQATEQPTIIGGTVCETAGENSPIHASCNNTATIGTTNTDGRIITNTDGRIITIIGGSSSTSNTGRITGTIKLPFGGLP